MGEEASSFNVKLKDSFCLFCLGLRQDRSQGLGAHPGEWGHLPNVVDFWSEPGGGTEESSPDRGRGETGVQCCKSCISWGLLFREGRNTS